MQLRPRREIGFFLMLGRLPLQLPVILVTFCGEFCLLHKCTDLDLGCRICSQNESSGFPFGDPAAILKENDDLLLVK